MDSCKEVYTKENSWASPTGVVYFYQQTHAQVCIKEERRKRKEGDFIFASDDILIKYKN